MIKSRVLGDFQEVRDDDDKESQRSQAGKGTLREKLDMGKK
jgi:hypothetical protein